MQEDLTNEYYHVNTSELKYKQVEAAALANTFNSAADKLESYYGKIRTEGMHAAQEFRGQYATLFVLNYGQCMDDAKRLADACRRAAKAVQQIAHAAEIEQENRRKAREAELNTTKQVNNGHGKDRVGSYYPKPSYVASEEPNIVVNPDDPEGKRSTEIDTSMTSSEKLANRIESSAGVSSAEPAALEKYVSFIQDTLNPDMEFYFSSIDTAYNRYLTECQWGMLVIDGLLKATMEWLIDNTHDATWISQVAQAFRQAGAGVHFTVSDAALTASLQQAGVSAGRKRLHVPDVQVYGAQPSSGYANDPVNVATGNFIEEEKDLSDGGVSLVRMYNSIAAAGAASTHEGYAAPVGAFGSGWSSTVDTHLGFTASGVVWADVDGRQVFFARAGAGFARAAGEAWWLHRYTVNPADSSASQASDSENGAAHDEANGGVREVTNVYGDPDNPGRVTQQVSEHGRVIDYTYLPGGITQITTGTHENTLETDSEDSGTADTAERALHPNTWVSDSKGRLVSVTSAEGSTVRFIYDAFGNRIQVTDLEGSRTVRSANTRGLVVKELASTGAMSITEYDDLDRPVHKRTYGSKDEWIRKDAPVKVISYEYAEEGFSRQPVAVTTDGATSRYTYTSAGQISSVTDPTGVVTRLSYEARGNLTGVLNAVGDMLKVEYDAQDRPVSVVSPSGGTMRVEYDAASRPVRVIDPAGNATVYTYTPAGKVASITDAVGGVRRFEYNAAGELVAQVAPDGARTVREINELGYTVAETDPLGHVTKFVHDGMGRVTEKIDPAGNVWASRYNAADTLVEHTDPTGVLTRVSRDSAAGEITHQDGVGNTATVGFDALGRVMSSIDPSGAVTSWAYQFLTNTTAAFAGEGDREPVPHQGASEPVCVQDPTENLVRVPGAHALRTCTDAAGQVSGEVCDAAGRVLRQVSASGAVTEYSYDACGRVASVTDADGVMTEYRYDADSRLVAKTRAGVVVESFVYDLCGRVLERRAGTKLVGRYAYDAAGRVVRCVDAAWGTRSFSYDACGRVVKAVSGVGGTCFF